MGSTCYDNEQAIIHDPETHQLFRLNIMSSLDSLYVYIHVVPYYEKPHYNQNNKAPEELSSD